MAFIGLLAVMLTAAVIILVQGVAPIVAGTVLYRKTAHKRLGLVLRIVGYCLLLPSLAVGACMTVIVLRQL